VTLLQQQAVATDGSSTGAAGAGHRTATEGLRQCNTQLSANCCGSVHCCRSLGGSSTGAAGAGHRATKEGLREVEHRLSIQY
jgi:hypothetical protein